MSAAGYGHVAAASLASSGALGAGASIAEAPGGVASPSYHGVESERFVVTDGTGATAFLKVSSPLLGDIADVARSAAAMRRVAAIGLAPRVEAVFPQERAILAEALGGDRAARIDDLMATETALKLVDMQKRVAGLEPFGWRFEIFPAIEDMLTRAEAAGATLPSDTARLAAALTRAGQAIEAAGTDYRPAHGDPASSNVMIAPDGTMKLVDFDLAADMDPYLALAALMNEVCSFEEEMTPLLEAHDGTVSRSAFARCRLLMAADDFYWSLRARLMETLSGGTALEYLKYSEWRLLRCRMHVQRPEFETAIRHAVTEDRQ